MGKKIANSVVIGVGKGGVGKTALATTLAALWAAEHSMRVLLVDGDVQASATRTMGLDPAKNLNGRSLADAVIDGDPLSVVAAPGRAGLDVVVAGRDTARLAQALVTDPHGSARLADAFTAIEGGYDRIVIDLPPAGGASMIPTAALTVGEYLLVPTTDHVHDLEGLRVLGDDLIEARSAIILLGVVLYKVGAAHRRARYEAYQEVRRILGGAAEPFSTVVRSAPDAYKRAMQDGLLVHEYLAKYGQLSVGERINRGISVPKNLPAVVAEFRDLAMEVNDRIADIERMTRPTPAP